MLFSIRIKPMNTPYYNINESKLMADIHLLKNSLHSFWGDNYICGYSVKTNSLPWLLNYLRKQDFYAEVVSAEEYDLSLRLGYDPSKVIYNGPIKDKDIFFNVINSKGIVNLDSHDELLWLEEKSYSLNFPAKIGLRVNCDLGAMCPEEKLAGDGIGRFGYSYENGTLKKVIDFINHLPNVKIVGLHMHASTKTRSVKAFRTLAKMAGMISEEYDLNLEYIDMGGGYLGGIPDKPNYKNYFEGICEELRAYFNPSDLTLIAEPGVSLISSATTFVTSVLDTKEIGDTVFVVTDGSRMNLNPQVTRHTYPHHLERTQSSDHLLPSQWICGATCMEYDRLFELKDVPALKVGDRIVYDRAGGYTMCLTPLFIHYFPAVYIEKQDGTIFTARKPWGNDEYLMNHYLE